jgi:hypothetical protein
MNGIRKNDTTTVAEIVKALDVEPLTSRLANEFFTSHSGGVA